MTGVKALAFLCAFPCAQGACTNLFTYRNVEAWTTLGMCAHTDDQSPIAIDTSKVVGDLPALDFTAGALGDGTAQTNEHTWQMNCPDSKSTVSFAKKDWKMTQYHFHSPSEHTFDGKHHDLEMHLVHSDGKGNTLVVAIVFQEGEGGLGNSYLEKVWDYFPGLVETKPVTSIPNPLASLVPDPRSAAYFHYTGSLTTPPCTNDTEWIIFQRVQSVSAEKLKQYRDDINKQPCNQMSNGPQSPDGVGKSWDETLGTNNRATQNLGARVVEQYAGINDGSSQDFPAWVYIAIGVCLVVFGGGFMFLVISKRGFSKSSGLGAQARECTPFPAETEYIIMA